MLVSKKYRVGKKCFWYFFWHLNHSNDSIKFLSIKLPKLNELIKIFEKMKYLLSMVSENHGYLSSKYSEIWMG